MNQAQRHDITTWIISQPHAGMRHQCLGLAKALGIKATIAPVDPPAWWRAIPVSWRLPFALTRISGAGDWAQQKTRQGENHAPDLIIACGRAAIAPTLALKKKSGCRAIYIHDPRTLHRHFDLIITARHDRSRQGSNIVVSDGALHDIDDQALQEARRGRTAQRLARLQPPPTALLLGGKSKHGRFTSRHLESWLHVITMMHQHQAMTLLLLPSRRSEEAHTQWLARRLTEAKIAFEIMRPQAQDNPYRAVLAQAERFIVTADSISMLSEACSLGRPVYIAEAPASARLRRFHTFLIENQSALPLDQWSPPSDHHAFTRLDVMAQPRKQAQALLDDIRRQKHLR